MGYFSSSNWTALIVIAIFVLVAGLVPLGSCDLGDDLSPYDDALTFSHYQGSCPHFEGIVHTTINDWIKKDYTLAASLIRLHFFDCSIRGCDGSILLDHEGSERRANASKTLRGFEVIDDIKAQVEKKCPKTISCADILTAAARDATVALGGPFWMVPYGRKDGKVSLAKEATLVPAGKERITDLLHFFQSKGLNVLDLVTLSGAHTIGRSSCGAVQHRLYDYKGTKKPDPTLEPKYLNYLRRKCRWASEYVDLDATTPKTFDNDYFTNLQKKMGLLSTDQGLYYDSRTSHLVTAMASQPHVFRHRFAASMVKLGNIIDYDNDEGEVRVKCSAVNYVKKNK